MSTCPICGQPGRATMRHLAYHVATNLGPKMGDYEGDLGQLLDDLEDGLREVAPHIASIPSEGASDA
jgi:hypothetical protein